ncbi:MAG: sulfur carrier protein ThiS adenylyltransferase ThiF [Candidatus Aminicenantaceae bacterium]
MTSSNISIRVNERILTITQGTSLGKVRDRVKPTADVLVVNGYPTVESYVLQDGDSLALIERGEVPSQDELEALMVSRHSPGVHAGLKQAVVGVAGLGGLGSAVATALARTGVGTLILVDFDVVEPSNLNRQQYFLDHLGRPKTEAMAGLLAGINPYTRIVSHQLRLDPINIPTVFKAADVIVECLDRAEEKVMLLETVADQLPKAYFIAASGLAGYGDSNRIRTFRIGERVFLVGDLVSPAEPGQGLMAPRVGIAAHHQANLVVSLLMNPARAYQEAEDFLNHRPPGE